MPFDEDIAKPIREVLSEECLAKEQRMFGGLAFMVKGDMCCGIVGQDLVIRIGADQQEKALSEPHVQTMDFSKRPMKDLFMSVLLDIALRQTSRSGSEKQ